MTIPESRSPTPMSGPALIRALSLNPTVRPNPSRDRQGALGAAQVLKKSPLPSRDCPRSIFRNKRYHGLP